MFNTSDWTGTWFGNDLQAELHCAVRLYPLIEEAVIWVELKKTKKKQISTKYLLQNMRWPNPTPILPECLVSRCQIHPDRIGREAPKASSDCQWAHWCQYLVESNQKLWWSVPQCYKCETMRMKTCRLLCTSFKCLSDLLAYPSSRHACFSRSSISISINSSVSLLDILSYRSLEDRENKFYSDSFHLKVKISNF